MLTGGRGRARLGPRCRHDLRVEGSSDQIRDPRTVAGEGVETDINKCTLKPLRRIDYYPITFTDGQWQQLQQAFPTGVCNWSARGVDQVPTIPWQTYQSDARGTKVIYGGQALGTAPAGSGGGWASDSFGSWTG